MKARAVMFILALCFVGAAASFGAADDAFMGTWKLNEAKSKLDAGTPKNNTVVYEALGDSVKVTIDGTGIDGTATHNEWTGKFDGKDYPVKGDPSRDAVSVRKIDDYNLEITNKKGGKVTTTIKAVYAKDGKSRVETVTGMNA